MTRLCKNSKTDVFAGFQHGQTYFVHQRDTNTVSPYKAL